MRIYPLAIPSSEASQYHADVHLKPSVILIAKILSDSAHILFPGEIGRAECPTTKTPIYIFKSTEIMPPCKKVSIWSKWAASNYINGWWLVDFAFQLNKEYRFRFGEDVPEYLTYIQPWMVAGMMQSFPRPERPAAKALDEFPLVLPHVDVLKIPQVEKMDIIDIYRNFYAAQKGKVRMKWTGRTMPHFMFPSDEIPF